MRALALWLLLSAGGCASSEPVVGGDDGTARGPFAAIHCDSLDASAP